MLAAAEIIDPTRKDVVIAILGASAALGGFVLVFLGILISEYKMFSNADHPGVRQKKRSASWPVLGVFCLCIATIGAALVWLAVPGGTCFYWFVVAMFAAELMAIVGAAAWTSYRVLT